jgi:hypothetical protein
MIPMYLIVNDAQPENIADEWGEDIGSTEGQGDE